MDIIHLADSERVSIEAPSGAKFEIRGRNGFAEDFTLPPEAKGFFVSRDHAHVEIVPDHPTAGAESRSVYVEGGIRDLRIKLNSPVLTAANTAAPA